MPSQRLSPLSLVDKLLEIRGLNLALEILDERIGLYAYRRFQTRNPVGITETELLLIRERIVARRDAAKEGR